MKYNTKTGATALTVPSGTYEGIDYHGSVPDDVAQRAGWVDVTPEIQELIDAAAAEAAEQAAIAAEQEHVAQAPENDLSTWSKRERCLLLITYKLALQHWPSMTKQQFLENVRAEWDAAME